MSRAERFDDERRRITESCFAKTDDQGQRQYSRAGKRRGEVLYGSVRAS
jgi:hypothetical protein